MAIQSRQNCRSLGEGDKGRSMKHGRGQPDIIPDGKGLGKGMPVEATIAAPKIADSTRGLTISAFGGNPVATRAAKATIDRIDSAGLVENARVAGRYRRVCLEVLDDKHLVLGDVR